MWIFLGILGFLALVITVILLSPVRVLIKTDKDGEIILRYKLLWKTFGEDPDPNSAIVRTLKKSTGVSQLEGKNIRKSTEEIGLADTVSESVEIIVTCLKAIWALLKRCTVRRLELDILCAGDDPAEVAMNYGRSCALVSAALELIRGYVHVRRRGQKIRISADYSGERESDFRIDLRLSVSFYRVLAEFFRVSYREAMRAEKARHAAQEKKPGVKAPRKKK